MSELDQYEENEKLNRFNKLINEQEILSKEERNFCIDWDVEESNTVLTYIGKNQWLNLNVYSEADHGEQQLRNEQGI